MSDRVRMLRGRPWAPLAAFGAVMLFGVDLVASQPLGAPATRCSSPPQPAAVDAHCGLTVVGAAHVVSVSGSQSTHSLTVVEKAPVALALGNHWWFWSAAVVCVVAALAAFQVLAAGRRIRDLRWYSLAILGALVGQQASANAGWTPTTAGMFAVGCGLAVLTAGDRQPLMLASSGVVLALSAWLRNSPIMVTSAPLPMTLPISSAAQIFLGIDLIVIALAMRWNFYARPRPRHHYDPEFDDA